MVQARCMSWRASRVTGRLKQAHNGPTACQRVDLQTPAYALLVLAAAATQSDVRLASLRGRTICCWS
jgi:hypothetical protein